MRQRINDALLYVIFILSYSIIFCVLWKWSEMEQQVSVPLTPVTTQMVTTTVRPEIIEQPKEEVIEVEETVDEIEEEVVHQEAKEPEWGFDFEYVCRVVAAESRGEPYEGQVAVAQCILNTSLATGMNPDKVVKQKYQYAKPVSKKLVTESVIEACRNVFLGYASVTDEPIRYFYSTKDGFVSGWHERNLVHVMTIGNHKFFKEK